MKVKTPKIYPFLEIWNDYNEVLAEVRMKDKNRSFIIFDESKEMVKKRRVVLELLKKHESVLREIEDAMIDYQRERIIEYPKVSPVVVKSNNPNSDAEYYNARVFWPERDGKQKELRVYLGRKEDLGNLDDPKTVHLAQQKISAQLKKRIKEGTLEV